MSDLRAIQDQIVDADMRKDLDGLRRLRMQLVAEFPDSDVTAEAWYKLGLDALYIGRDLDIAVEKFTEAAKLKHPYWSSAARTSLGLCLFHQKKTQKALFELRKVAYPESPSSHSVTALMFLETILLQDQKPDEADRVRKERIVQLEKLIHLNAAPEQAADRGLFLYMLGIALRDNGDIDRSRTSFEKAHAIGPNVLDPQIYKSVVEMLK